MVEFPSQLAWFLVHPQTQVLAVRAYIPQDWEV